MASSKVQTRVVSACLDGHTDQQQRQRRCKVVGRGIHALGVKGQGGAGAVDGLDQCVVEGPRDPGAVAVAIGFQRLEPQAGTCAGFDQRLECAAWVKRRLQAGVQLATQVQLAADGDKAWHIQLVFLDAGEVGRIDKTVPGPLLHLRGKIEIQAGGIPE